MAKIIRRGSLPEDKVHKLTCRNCNTVAEFEQKEGRFSIDQRDGDAMAFTCPVCKKDIWDGGGVAQQWDR